VEIQVGGSSVRKIGTHDFFGERSILTNEIRSASVVAKTAVTCWCMNQATFTSLLSKKIISDLKRRMQLQDESV
jgi:CRP-like cAMP-binding protein